jgi:hypothetical protein
MNKGEVYMLFEEVLETEEYFDELNKKIFDFIDSLDIDELEEDQAELLDDLMEFISEEEFEDQELDEIAKKRVVRGGKIIRKIPPKKGYKVVNGRYVKMSASEKRVRSKAAKRGARKSRSKKASTIRKRKKSMKKINR